MYFLLIEAAISAGEKSYSFSSKGDTFNTPKKQYQNIPFFLRECFI